MKRITLLTFNPSHGAKINNAELEMAKVVWSAGIDHVSGALSKPSKNAQHSCQKMLLATHRTIATDIAAFNAQKDNANGYKTLRQYLWHVCAAEING